MLFRKNNDISEIHSFYISTGSGIQEKPVAYGPGSMINGSVMITLFRPIFAYSIRIVFKCEETDLSKKETSIIFSVDTVIWGGADIVDLKPQELSSGNHMYLFAIKLPEVNYPPSIHSNEFGHQIHYSLQGVIDLVSGRPHKTLIIPIMYLPLVASNPNQLSKKAQSFQKGSKQIEAVAELIKPAYCPGDVCTIKLTTTTNSETKVVQAHIAFNAISTILAPDGTNYIHKQHTLLNESFVVSIPKHSKNHQNVLKFKLPPQLVPTFTSKLSKYMDICYEIAITIPFIYNNNNNNNNNNRLFLPQPTPNTINLPILIATVPPGYPINIKTQDTDELPTFIPNIESPLPSPVNYPADLAYSVSPSGSFEIDDGVADNFLLTTEVVQQDASGHLIVPVP